MTSPDEPHGASRDAARAREFFVGIDSDGCAFDTMEVKHKECFIPAIIRFYRLAAVSKAARECAEFVNLYSKSRGVNRFPALVEALDLLADRPEVAERGFAVPKVDGLRDWLARETTLGNASLRAEVERTGDADLRLALQWSEAANASIAETVHAVPPFPNVREALASIGRSADAMVISSTPAEALRREWAEHGLADAVGSIAGQERGGKEHILKDAIAGRYDPAKVLMIGDAPGDRKAAEAAGVLYYPIEPGAEAESWRRFLDEALPKFLDGTYAGAYMAERVARFESLLPETPPWAAR